MRLVRFAQTDKIPRSGIIHGERILPLADGIDLIGAATTGYQTAPGSLRLDDVDLLSPVQNPPSVRDFISFEGHAQSANRAQGRELNEVWYEQPVFFFSNPAAVVGPREPIAISPGSRAFDYEVEIAAVIGRPGGDIPVSSAEEHIAGYMLFCDWSARDLQERETRVGLGPAKGKDSASTFGPFLVTLDDLETFRSGKGYDITFTVSVNGTQYGRGNWASIYWSFAQMISYASRGTRLQRGDVIGGGTLPGCSILELAGAFPYLSPGDIVEIDGGPFGVIKQEIVGPMEPAGLGPGGQPAKRQDERIEATT